MEERRRNIQELLNTIDDNFNEPGEIARDVGNERGVIRADFFKFKNITRSF